MHMIMMMMSPGGGRRADRLIGARCAAKLKDPVPLLPMWKDAGGPIGPGDADRNRTEPSSRHAYFSFFRVLCYF